MPPSDRVVIGRGKQEMASAPERGLHDIEETPLLRDTTTSSAPRLPYNNNNCDLENDTITRTSDECTDSLRSLSPQGRPTGVNNAYVTLPVCVLLALVSGTMYGYGRYARDLKNVLELSQFELERLGILLDMGNYCGHPVTGYIYDHLGPKFSCIGSALIVFLAYITIHLAILDEEHYLVPVGILNVCFSLVGFGAGLGYISALGSTTKSFATSPHKSLAIALVAAAYGLCSALVGISYGYLGLKSFFLVWAILVGVVNLMGASVLDFDGTPLHGSEILEALEKEAGSKTASVQARYIEQLYEQGGVINSVRAMVYSVRMEIQERYIAFRSTEFWILFAAFAGCTGCGLFVINNVSLMVESVGGKDLLAGNLVILLSISNTAGRIIMGWLADRFNKLFLLAVLAVVMALGLVWSAYSTMADAQLHLIVTIVTVAMAYGGSWVLIVCILSEWWGSHDFGMNYGVIAMGSALAGMFVNAASAFVYEEHATKGICVGTQCYHTVFLLAGVIATTTTGLLAFLAYRSKQQELQV